MELFLNNKLSGSIPAELAGSGVSKLWLKDNALSSEIPVEFATQESLNEFYVFDNPGLGPVPAALSSKSEPLVGRIGETPGPGPSSVTRFWITTVWPSARTTPLRLRASEGEPGSGSPTTPWTSAAAAHMPSWSWPQGGLHRHHDPGSGR